MPQFEEARREIPITDLSLPEDIRRVEVGAVWREAPEDPDRSRIGSDQSGADGQLYEA